MNKQIITVRGGGATLKELVKQAENMMPVKLKRICPPIEIHVLTLEKYNDRVRGHTAMEGVHFIRDPKEMWALAIVARKVKKNDKACLILMTMNGRGNGHDQWRFMEGVLAACLQCSYVQESVIHSTTDATKGLPFY